MAAHRVYLHHEMAKAGDSVVVGGDEAHHLARVKRVGPGEAVELRDGRGGVGTAQVAETRKRGGAWEIVLRVESAARVEMPAFKVEVWSSVPKGDRCEEMIDGLCQVGAWEWSPLRTERSVVDPREGKLARLQRRAMEATKQCGRAWGLSIGEGGGIEEATNAERVIVADSTGAVFLPSMVEGVRVARLLVGPEAGFTQHELSMCIGRGAVPAKFGPHTMRVETAAVVAAAMVVNARTLHS